MKSKLESICRYLEQSLVEREVPARLSLLAALSGEHLLLVGPPGTAKSELARKLHHVFNQAQYFERLLTKFSVPEELFGPLSIKALEEDRYQRLTENYLPQASIAFIDEVFKANSAILNALLTLLNEREFDNGCERVTTPLICVLAASNELPEDDSLQALYDRFLLRYQVNSISDDRFDELLDLSSERLELLSSDDCLSLNDVEKIQQSANKIQLSDKARQLIKDLRHYLKQKVVYISDRRWRKIIKLLQVAAHTNNQTEIKQLDCLLLIHCVWQEPEQQQDLRRWLKNYLKLDLKDTVDRLEKLVATWEQKSHADQNKEIHKTDEKGIKLFRTPEGEITTHHEKISMAERDNEVLYLAPPDQEDRTNNGQGYTLTELEQEFFDDSFKQTHINGKWVDVQNYVNNTQNRLVQRIEYDPITEPFYFSGKYVQSALDDIHHVLNELEQIKHHFDDKLKSIKPIQDNHIWLKAGFIESIINDVIDLYSKIEEYESRMKQVEGIIGSLPVQQAPSAAAL